MHQFKDRLSRTWDITIDLPAIKIVRQLTGVDLFAGDDADGLFGGLLNDHAKLVDVLFVLCKKQCEARQLSDEQFGQSFDGDALEAAADAFTEELIDFFPKRKQEPLRALLAKGKRIGERGLAHVTGRLAKLDPEKIDFERLEKLLGKRKPSLGDLLDSSESLPTAAPSAN